MSRVEAARLYAAAGFPIVKDRPVNRCGRPVTPRVTFVDINGDKWPEAVLTDGETCCYGNTGQGFSLVSKLASGDWKLITRGTGIPEFLKTTGVGGWPDISVGGPGFCFPVECWNGNEYKLQRWKYEGKA